MVVRTADLIVRPASAADAGAILSINSDGLPGVTLLQLAEVRAWTAFGYVCIAERDGQVVGYAIALPSGVEYDGEEYRRLVATLPSFLYIDQIAVAAAHVRTHVGSALYDAIERDARHATCPQLVCEVNLRPLNATSLLFHAKRGFVGLDVMETTDGRRVLLMQKTLSERSRAV